MIAFFSVASSRTAAARRSRALPRRGPRQARSTRTSPGVGSPPARSRVLVRGDERDLRSCRCAWAPALGRPPVRAAPSPRASHVIASVNGPGCSCVIECRGRRPVAALQRPPRRDGRHRPHAGPRGAAEPVGRVESVRWGSASLTRGRPRPGPSAGRGTSGSRSRAAPRRAAPRASGGRRGCEVGVDRFAASPPTRVNVCEGMWSACGADGASSA